MINVTKSYLPELKKYVELLEGIWDRGHLTNHGPLVLELESKLTQYLGARHFFFLNNGTIAIQIAIKALDIKGEVITTPFSYVATTSSIVWEQAEPVFVDIDPLTLTIDPAKIEAAITPRTTAILATHVYGIPCDVEAIEAIAKRHNLKVIYDAAHAFGVQFKGQSLLNYGDISTLSFHATKLFHTVEGGAVVTGDADLAHRISYLRNFGHNGQEAFWGLGVNGKNSEFHAAMGLCVLPHMAEIIADRGKISGWYDAALIQKLQGQLVRPTLPAATVYNYSYYPVLFENEERLVAVRDALNKENIFPRRYFYPALHHLPYITKQYNLPVTENASRTVLCLPLYYGLEAASVEQINSIILKTLGA